MPINRPTRLTAWGAAAIYAVAAIVWSWPLLPRITTGIAWDLGDPMLVAWVMGWVNDSVLALARGDVARFLALWDAPIFHPQPLALAYSEHFIPQALMVLPVHAATGNVILSYNVAVLATFVLSGLGMFLLARELTGNIAAALLAGAVFAFTPYRVDQLSHLQILSGQWMPFAVYGFRRYFTTGQRRPLVWGALAFAVQSISSGYLLLFFAPFLAAYVLFEMWQRRLLRRRQTWMQLSAAAIASSMLIVPFLVPYLVVRASTLGPRAYREILAFGADIYAYATSDPYIRWSAELLDIRRGHAENETFPGVVALLMAAAAAVILARRALVRWRTSAIRDGWRAVPAAILVLLAIVSLGLAAWIALTGGRIIEAAGAEIRLRNLGRVLLAAGAAAAIAAALSRRLRAACSLRSASLAAPALIFAAAALMLSFGPRIETMNEFVGHGPYALLLKYVPGYDGLRVPSRFALIAIFWLSIAGAYAAAALARSGRAGTAAAAAFALIAVAESRPTPFNISLPFPEKDAAPLTMTHRLQYAEPLYSTLRDMPRGVLIELPFGTTGWDLQFMHAQRRHGWPLVNGYSGDFPQTFRRTALVSDLFAEPERAWWAIERSGASHVIVHEWAFFSLDRGKRVSQWLREHGAVEVARTENDALFRLPGGIRHR